MSRPSEAIRRFLSCRTPGALRRLRDAGDEGFTLIELVITLVILPLILGAIAVALLVTFQDQVGVSTRISTSADAQVTSAYFVRDVESAMYVTTTATPAPGSVAWPSTAGPTGACGSGTELIVSLAWPGGQQSITKTATVVSYWRMSNGLLERELCKGSASPSSGITSRDFVSPFAHALLSCAASDPCGTAATRWVPATTVSGITLSATEPLTKTQPLAKSKGSTKGSYDFNLTAAPRATNAQGAYAHGGTGPTPPTVPPILALGAGTAIVKESSKASISVTTGKAVLNGGYFDMANNTKFIAPHIDVAQGNTPCRTGKCGSKSSKGASTVEICATAKTPPPGGTCYTAAKTPKPWTSGTILRDPLATLADPTPGALGLSLITTCQPHAGTLQPGEYDCGGATLKVSGGETATLVHGVYIFDTGISVTGGAKLDGNTVLIYLPCRTYDHWVPATTKAATCSEKFQVSNSTLTVSPLRTEPYSDLWLWVNKGIATTTPTGKGTYVKLTATSGTTGITVTGGVLYAPSVEVKVSGRGTASTTVGSIIATRFWVLNGKITVRGFG